MLTYTLALVFKTALRAKWLVRNWNNSLAFSFSLRSSHQHHKKLGYSSQDLADQSGMPHNTRVAEFGSLLARAKWPEKFYQAHKWYCWASLVKTKGKKSMELIQQMFLSCSDTHASWGWACPMPQTMGRTNRRVFPLKVCILITNSNESDHLTLF